MGGLGTDAESALDCLLHNLQDHGYDVEGLEARIKAVWNPSTGEGNGATTFYHLYLVFKSLDKSNCLDESELIVGRTYRCEMYDGTAAVLRFDGEGTFEDESLAGDVRYAFEEINPDEITKLVDKLDEAHEEELDAASRWSLYSTQLAEMGVNPNTWRRKYAKHA